MIKKLFYNFILNYGLISPTSQIRLSLCIPIPTKNRKSTEYQKIGYHEEITRKWQSGFPYFVFRQVYYRYLEFYILLYALIGERSAESEFIYGKN